MKKLREDIFKLARCISQSELRKNPQLKMKLDLLLESAKILERQNIKYQFKLKDFINKEMLLN